MFYLLFLFRKVNFKAVEKIFIVTFIMTSLLTSSNIRTDNKSLSDTNSGISDFLA